MLGGGCSCYDGFSGASCEVDCTGAASSTPHCSNKGVCNATGANTTDPPCACDAGHTGTHCEVDCSGDASQTAHCKFKGTCDAAPGSAVASPTCSCVEGYAGSRCGIDCTGIASWTAHCHRNGVCDATGGSSNHKPACFCVAGKVGDRCESNGVNACNDDGDETVDGGCACKSGRGGLKCSIDCSGAAADTAHCSHVGTCDASAGDESDPTCACLEGHTGATCDDCSGHGGLLDHTEDPRTTCTCVEGFATPNCSVPCCGGGNGKATDCSAAGTGQQDCACPFGTLDDVSGACPFAVDGAAEFTVAENSAPGASACLNTTRMRSAPYNLVPSFEIVGGAAADMFTIGDADGCLGLEVGRVLNYESTALHHARVNVTFEQGGTLAWNAVDLDVVVTDVPDTNVTRVAGELGSALKAHGGSLTFFVCGKDLRSVSAKVGSASRTDCSLANEDGRKAACGDGGGDDGGGGDGRIFPEHPSPILHAPRDIISRKGKSLTPI